MLGFNVPILNSMRVNVNRTISLPQIQQSIVLSDCRIGIKQNSLSFHPLQLARLPQHRRPLGLPRRDPGPGHGGLRRLRHPAHIPAPQLPARGPGVGHGRAIREVGRTRVSVGLRQRRLCPGGHPGRGPAWALGHPRRRAVYPLPPLQRPAGGGGQGGAGGLPFQEAIQQRGAEGGERLLLFTEPDRQALLTRQTGLLSVVVKQSSLGDPNPCYQFFEAGDCVRSPEVRHLSCQANRAKFKLGHSTERHFRFCGNP